MLKRTTAAWYEVAYLDAEHFEDEGCSKNDCSETEHRTVQKLNTNRSETEHKRKEDKLKDKHTHNSANAKTNTHTLKDKTQSPPSPPPPPSYEDEVDYIQVAKDMADYFENDERGKTEWAWMCSTKRVKVAPISITSQWAAKHQDAPYLLKNWRKHTGKVINWIQPQSRRNYNNTSQVEQTYQAPSTNQVQRKRNKVSPEELQAIKDKIKNGKLAG